MHVELWKWKWLDSNRLFYEKIQLNCTWFRQIQDSHQVTKIAFQANSWSQGKNTANLQKKPSWRAKKVFPNHRLSFFFSGDDFGGFALKREQKSSIFCQISSTIEINRDHCALLEVMTHSMTFHAVPPFSFLFFSLSLSLSLTNHKVARP